MIHISFFKLIDCLLTSQTKTFDIVFNKYATVIPDEEERVGGPPSRTWQRIRGQKLCCRRLTLISETVSPIVKG